MYYPTQGAWNLSQKTQGTRRGTLERVPNDHRSLLRPRCTKQNNKSANKIKNKQTKKHLKANFKKSETSNIQKHTDNSNKAEKVGIV